VLAFLAGAVFWLALRGGQFDDLDGPGLKVLADDDRAPPPLPEGRFDPGQRGAGPPP
jgi:cbb3-type cytochrome oxidase maturation protein